MKGVIIYQMGKVGTYTIRGALEQAGIPFVHAHYLMPVNWGEWSIAEGPGDGNVYHQVREQPRSWKIISLVRDPIQRNLSAFFWTYNRYINQDYPTAFNTELVQTFVEEYKHEYGLAWFDLEFYPFMEFDIYSEPFDHSRGYKIYQTPYSDLLVLRTEQLESIGSKALKEFLGINVTIQRKNRTKDRQGGEVYEQFLEFAKLPEHYVNWMYESKLAQHFLTSEERQRLRTRWIRSRSSMDRAQVS